MRTFLFIFQLLSSAQAQESPVLRIAASASLAREAQTVASEAEKKFGMRIEVISGGTSKLRTQIEQGAPFDFFLSADPEKLTGERIRIADGRLVLWSLRPRADLPEGDVFLHGEYKYVATSHPELTPYGKAAAQVLQKLNVPLTKRVHAQNVGQVAEWLHARSADLGFVAASMFEGGVPDTGSYWLVPADWHAPIVQQWFPLRPNTLQNQQFWSWLQARTATSSFASHGDLRGEDLKAVGVSLRLALISTLILLGFGVPLVWILYIYRRRLWSRATRALIALPLALPPTVLGFYLLIFFTQFSVQWAFTFQGLVLGSVLYSLPFVLQPIYAALEQQGPTIFEQASTLGLRPIAVFFRIGVPLLRNAITAGGLLGFAHTLGEFGVVLMIGGGLSGKTRVASMALYEHVEAMRYAEAHRLALFLLVFSFLLILAVHYFQNRDPQKSP